MNEALQNANARIAQANTLEQKIQTIISTLASKGVDVSNAQATFADFKNQVSAAQQALSGVPSLLGQLSTTNLSGDMQIVHQIGSDFEAARSAGQQAKSDLQTLHSDWQSIQGTLGGGTGSGSSPSTTVAPGAGNSPGTTSPPGSGSSPSTTVAPGSGSTSGSGTSA